MRLSRANLPQRFGFSRGLPVVRPVVWAVLCLGLAGTACKGDPVGRQCFIPTPEQDGGAAVTVVGTGLECPSRTCLHIAATSPDMCTDECSSNSDCEASSDTPCQNGFVCMVPVVVGDFCCQKLCVCRDYLTLPDGGAAPPPPAACNADNPINECCNLEGRRGNAMYPQCR
jgi:hypothetical protein